MAHPPRAAVRFADADTPALAKIGIRLGLALALVLLVTFIAYFGRDGYADAAEDGITLLDCFYYATVSISTTGYGDVRPESDSARLLTAIFVTPARILFLIILVGTTIEVLADRTRAAFRVTTWTARLKDHVIICGYGTKGRSAAGALRSRGMPREDIVVIDATASAQDDANADGLVVIAGDAARRDVLERAQVRKARAVVVAPQRDDAAVLITLTVRQLNAHVPVIAAARETENNALLRQSGASSVIESSSAAGRLLGVATLAPRVADILEDLLDIGRGLDIHERPAAPSEFGPLTAMARVHPVVAIVRAGETLRFDHPDAAEIREGDRLVFLCTAGKEAP